MPLKNKVIGMNEIDIENLIVRFHHDTDTIQRLALFISENNKVSGVFFTLQRLYDLILPSFLVNY